MDLQTMRRYECATEFLSGTDPAKAENLLSQIQNPATVTAEFWPPIAGLSKQIACKDVTLLHLAAYHGWLGIIKKLNAYDCRDSNGFTPLHYAAFTKNNLEVVKYLVSMLCDPRIPNNHGNLPLHIACLEGHLNIARYFIRVTRCPAISPNNSGHTPLHCASEFGHMNIIQYLTPIGAEVGCDPTTADSNGSLPLHIACENNHLEAAVYFITELKCNPNSKNQHGFTPLHYASQNGHMEIIKRSKKLGCDPFIPNNDNDLPLHIACKNGHLEAAVYFITKLNCDPNSKGKNGFTPLHYATQGGHMEVVECLITKLGSELATPDSNGNFPLHIAYLNGHLHVAKYFINEQNCDSNCQSQNGFTPLHFASQNGHMSIVESSIELGCDPTIPNSDTDLPLHIACKNGHLKATEYFITKLKCDPNCQGRDGFTPLHYASQGGHIEVVQSLMKLGGKPKIPDSMSRSPLHIACLNDQLEITKFFSEQKKLDKKSTTPIHCTTPLHYASQGGHMEIIQYLITELGCSPEIKDIYGSLPLHIACKFGHLIATKYFITEQKCDKTSQGQNGFTPLHCASQGGHIKIVKYLIEELNCSPFTADNDDDLPLHIACRNGHLNVTRYLITEKLCDSTSRGKCGLTPLHYASQGGHMEIVKYLILEVGCDPSALVDNCRRTVLHWASFHGYISMVQWLLHNAGNIDIMAKDNDGNTCLDMAITKQNYELLKIFKHLIRSVEHFSIQKCNKTFLTGDSGAGKTTLAAVVAERASKKSFNWLDSRRKIKDVDRNTAGIVPSFLESHELGKMVVYDLAGQTEYHSSHFAIMETMMQKSPATFINVIDLRKTDDEIKKQLCYWLNFIDNATSKTTIKSCVLVVGSHADKLKKSKETHLIQRRSTLIADLCTSKVHRQEFMGIITMDSRRINSDDTNRFVSLLCQCQQNVSARAPSMSYYCHLLYAFLQSKPKMPFCTLKELISLVSSSEDCPIPVHSLTELLTTLNDKGVVIFLENPPELESWIIVQIKMLLKAIDGQLFGEVESKEKVVTGIIHSSTLKQLFPDFNLGMLVGFLQTLELCHCVNLSGILTNLQSIEASLQGDIENDFFFPSLLNICRPSILPGEESFSFGWCLCCKEPEYQFFTSRFLHVLLLRLAYTFPLASGNHDSFHQNQTGCNVWKNGISWENEEGIGTIVELADNQRLLVLVSHKTASRPVECNKHHCAVIRLVLDLQQQFCPNVETNEYLISHSLLKNWTTDIEFPRDNDLFPIENVAKSMLLHKPYILSCNNDTSDFLTKNVLEFEPYYRMSYSSVFRLMNSSKADEPVSETLLLDVNKFRCPLHQLRPPQKHSSVRKCVDQLSMFAGRNIFFVEKNIEDTFAAHTSCMDIDDLSDFDSRPFSTLDEELNKTHLHFLVAALENISDWIHLGLFLGVKYSTLMEIEKEERGKIKDCKLRMLVEWLKSSKKPCTKHQLIKACYQTAVPLIYRHQQLYLCCMPDK